MDIVRSVINRMDIWNVLALLAALLVFVAVIGGFITVNASHDSDERVMQSIVSGCSTSSDYAQCVADAAKSVGLSADKDMKQYVVDKCFSNNSGSAQQDCVSRVTDSLGLNP